MKPTNNIVTDPMIQTALGTDGSISDNDYFGIPSSASSGSAAGGNFNGHGNEEWGIEAHNAKQYQSASAAQQPPKPPSSQRAPPPPPTPDADSFFSGSSSRSTMGRQRKVAREW